MHAIKDIIITVFIIFPMVVPTPDDLLQSSIQHDQRGISKGTFVATSTMEPRSPSTSLMEPRSLDPHVPGACTHC